MVRILHYGNLILNSRLNFEFSECHHSLVRDCRRKIMDSHWPQINSKRIREKAQEIQLYCAQKWDHMTPRAFELARLSFERLLENIAKRDKYSMAASVAEDIIHEMDALDDYVARCSEKQAIILARSIVYKCVGDDLNLYPVSAEKKLLRSKARGFRECDIPKEEMTVQDFLFVASSIAEGENYSKSTMRAVYDWFREIGLTPTQARVFSILFRSNKPRSIKSLPQYEIFHLEYRNAVNELVNKGFICKLPDDLYCVTETIIA